MKRDMDLIRSILLQIEAKATLTPETLEPGKVDPEVFHRHVEMLYDSGMIEGTAHVVSMYPWKNVDVKDLTMQGHDFLGVVSNDTVWKRITKAFEPAELARMSLSAIKDIGVAAVKAWAFDKLGLKG